MEIKIYADVVFFINLFMDFFIFWVTGRLAKMKASFLHIFLGSLTVSILYCVILFIPFLNQFYNFIGSVCILTVGIVITFGPKKWKQFLKLLVLAHVSAFMIGGAAMALFYYTNLSALVGNAVGISKVHFSIKLLVLSTACIYVFLKLSMGWLQANVINKKAYCDVKISFDGREEEFTALIDTGNSLSDPLTGGAVIIAEFSAVKDFFSPALQLDFYENGKLDYVSLLQKYKNDPVIQKIRLIPFSSLGNKNGMLIGFQSDKVETIWEEKELILKGATIAVSQNCLCKNKSYKGLVNPEIFQSL